MGTFQNVIHAAEKGFDKFNHAFRKRRGYEKDIHIVAYHGFGNNEKARIQGRILKDRGILPEAKDDSVFKNIERVYKHFASKELPNVSVSLHAYGEVFLTSSDEEGYFTFEIPRSILPENELFHTVKLQVDLGKGETISKQGWLQTPVLDTKMGVISDIDDTILQTGATSMLRMIRNTFTQNAKTRLSFPGVDALYQGLQKGTSEHPVNPIFYLSNGPWNLFDFLDDFMELNNIPKGSILLRDWGIDKRKLIKNDDHKLNMMRLLLSSYSTLPFILIGDSGEKDPEYYQQIVEEHPGKVLAVYIRNVTSEKRNMEVQQIAVEVTKKGVPMLLMQDSLHAAEHAQKNGWIDSSVLNHIKNTLS